MSNGKTTDIPVHEGDCGFCRACTDIVAEWDFGENGRRLICADCLAWLEGVKDDDR